ncbi:hypothetical protein GN956_G23371 [Arapaima gigas]
MSPRRRKLRQKERRRGLDGQEAQTGTGCVEKLALKYMEMCKVESSTDSGSDTSPRWSDTSTKGCTSSVCERRTLQKMMSFVSKPAGYHHLVGLDPYDGSSEDSEESAGPRAHGQIGFRMHGRKCAVKTGVMAQLTADVQMRSSSDSEAWPNDTGVPYPKGTRLQTEESPTDSGVHNESLLCVPGLSCTCVTPPGVLKSPAHLSRSHKLYLRLPQSPSSERSFPKRKSCVAGAEAGERDLRKRQRVVEMEVDQL